MSYLLYTLSLKMKTKLKKLLFLTLLMVIFSNFIYVLSFSQQVVVRFYVFSSPDCGYCEELEEKYLPEIFEKYGEKTEIKILDVFNSEEYELWIKFSKKFQVTEPLLPTIVIDDVFLSGLDDIEAKLESEIDRILKEGGCEFPEIGEIEEVTTEETAEATTEVTEEAKTKEIFIAYFYRAGCKECDNVYYLLNYLQNKYTNLVIKQYDISDSSNIELFESLCKINKVERENWLKVPAIFIGNNYLIGENINRTDTEELINKYIFTGTDSPEQLVKNYLKDAPESIIERFKKFTILPIILAGLIDGINPCAFATLIFFLSYLIYMGRSRREIVLISISFSLAIFLTYLLLGVGFLKIITSLKIFSIISKIVYIITVCISLILGILNFVDFFRVKKGKTNKTILQLPMFLKREIHRTIRKGSKTRLFIISAFLVGMVVSILELACTGQIYLPTIIYVSTIPNLKFKAYLFLILYNLMFILPLVVIFILYYIGATSKKIENILKSNVAKVKLITGSFFIVLSIFLIIYIV